MEPRSASSPHRWRSASSAKSRLQQRNDRKISSILSYLDNVAETPPLTRSTLLSHDNGSCAVLSGMTASEFGGSACDSLTEQAETVFSGVKERMERLRREGREKDEEIARLRASLAGAEERVGAAVQAAEKQAALQQADLEHTLKRNMTLVKQLIADKEALAERCDSKCTELKDQEQRQERMRHQHLSEVAALRREMAASDKKKREAWTASETKKIKAAAVKALEPDIASLISKHRAELRRLEEDHGQELRRKEAQLAEKDRELLQAQARAVQQGEEAVAAVRVKMSDALEKQAAEHESRTSDLRRKSSASEEAAEKLLEDTKREYQRRVEALVAEAETAKKREAAARSELSEELEEVRQRLRQEKEAEVRQIRAMVEAERERKLAEVERRLAGEQEEELRSRDDAIRKRLEREFDVKVEKLVSHLEEKAFEHSDEQRQRVKKLKDKTSSLQKENERLRLRVDTTESDATQLRVVLEEKEETLKREAIRLQRQREEFESEREATEEDVARRLKASEKLLAAQYTKRLEDLQEEKNSLTATAAALQASLEYQHASEEEQLAELRDKHGEELEAVQQRVVLALQKKDQEIAGLRQTVTRLEAKMRQAEGVLEQHRELLCP